MRAIRSLVFYGLFFTWTFIAVVTGLALLPAPRRHTLRLGRVWCRGVLTLLRRITGIDFEVRGAPPQSAAIIASKHQSSWETFVFPVLLSMPAYVLKRELTRIPLLGRCFRKAGHIAVDRTAGASALRPLIRAARAVAAEDRPIVIFPEGTRTPAGQPGQYQPGVSALYLQLGLPVVPVALNSGLFWPRRALLKTPGRIVIAFLEPIAPGLTRQAFDRELRRRIEEATRSLEAEAMAGRA
ncbi:MAG: lysophospholipid acyltransferase family protein [Alphaproteobacteria bacterium]